MSVNRSIQDLYDLLLKKAKEDGIITSEEQAILDHVELEIEKYEKMVEEAMEDNVITEEESNQLKKQRSIMLEGAWVTADEDSVISQDEARLLNLLLKLLKKFDLED